MNKTKIDWADSTWNIVTGCHHGCEYCYARGIARRFEGFYDDALGKNDKVVGALMLALDVPLYRMTDAGKMVKASYPYGFTPTFHRYKLDEYKNKKGRTIFVSSMGDLFGDFIPDEWIAEVFAACVAAPQHRYLFLTKNPKRYVRLADKGLLPKGDNYWYGSTTTTESAPFFMSGFWNTFVSIEPIQGPFDIPNAPHRHVKWVIVGAENGQRKDKVFPVGVWIDNIVQNCRESGAAVFMKDSLRVLMGGDFVQEYPWEV